MLTNKAFSWDDARKECKQIGKKLATVGLRSCADQKKQNKNSISRVKEYELLCHDTMSKKEWRLFSRNTLKTDTKILACYSPLFYLLTSRRNDAIKITKTANEQIWKPD